MIIYSNERKNHQLHASMLQYKNDKNNNVNNDDDAEDKKIVQGQSWVTLQIVYLSIIDDVYHPWRDYNVRNKICQF